MKEVMKPGKFVAMLFTIAAVCTLITLFLMVFWGRETRGLVAFHAFTAGLLVTSVVGNWCLYRKRHEEDEKEDPEPEQRAEQEQESEQEKEQ